MRKCSHPVWGVVLVAVLGAGLAGCEQIGMLKGKIAYKEANDFYRAGNYQEAASAYERAIAEGCASGECSPAELNYSYFFLANSYDNLYRPARQGQAENDAYLQDAVKYYSEAAEKSPDPEYRKRALQYMAQVYSADKLNDPDKAVPIIERLIQMDPNDLNNYYQMSKLYEDAMQPEQAEAMLLKARDIRPNDPEVYAQMARFYNGQGNFEKEMEALKIRAEKDPTSPEAEYTIAVKYWQRACLPRNRFCESLEGPANEKPGYIKEGLAATDRALAIRADYVDALTYKNLLLRSQAYVEPNRAQDLLKQADALQQQAIDIMNRQKGEAAAAAEAGDAPPAGEE